MKEITIQIPDGKNAEWVNGILTLVDEPNADKRSITERVKTFEDACRELGEGHQYVKAYREWMRIMYAECDDISAYLKLRIITAALNEGWEPQFTKGEYRYFPWFYLYTKEEYDEMDEERKQRCVLRSGGSTDANYGFVYVVADYDASYSSAYVGERLAFKSRALAKYAGKQFIEEWADFLFKIT